MPKKKADEKRKYARLEIRSKVNFSIVETSKDQKSSKRFRGIGKNIGVEGILFASNQELKAGTLLDMEIFLPDKADPVYIAGEVRWCRTVKKTKVKTENYDIGVKFLNIDKNHVLMLIKYTCGSLASE